MAMTKDRLLALVATLVNGLLGAYLGHFNQSSVGEAGIAILLSLPGLAIIWFRQSLQDRAFAFPRGVRNESPPGLLALVGWVFLLLVLILYVHRLSSHL